LTICGKPWVPSVSGTGVSTRRMFAPGAIAWEYSTSSDVSCAQPTICGNFVGLNAGTLPTGRMILKLGGAGRPKPLSKVASSLWMFWKP